MSQKSVECERKKGVKKCQKTNTAKRGSQKLVRHQGVLRRHWSYWCCALRRLHELYNETPRSMTILLSRAGTQPGLTKRAATALATEYDQDGWLIW